MFRKAKLNPYIDLMYCGNCRDMKIHCFQYYGLYMDSHSELSTCITCKNEYVIPLGELE